MKKFGVCVAAGGLVLALAGLSSAANAETLTFIGSGGISGVEHEFSYR